MMHLLGDGKIIIITIVRGFSLLLLDQHLSSADNLLLEGSYQRKAGWSGRADDTIIIRNPRVDADYDST